MKTRKLLYLIAMLSCVVIGCSASPMAPAKPSTVSTSPTDTFLPFKPVGRPSDEIRKLVAQYGSFVVIIGSEDGHTDHVLKYWSVKDRLGFPFYLWINNSNDELRENVRSMLHELYGREQQSGWLFFPAVLHFGTNKAGKIDALHASDVHYHYSTEPYRAITDGFYDELTAWQREQTAAPLPSLAPGALKTAKDAPLVPDPGVSPVSPPGGLPVGTPAGPVKAK